MEELLEEDATLAALEETACELASDDAVLATLLAGTEEGSAELTATELFAGAEDGATELTATLELLTIGVDDGAGVDDVAIELTTTLELLTATELLLFGLLPDELPPPPHAVSAHNTEHRMPVATFFM